MVSKHVTRPHQGELNPSSFPNSSGNPAPRKINGVMILLWTLLITGFLGIMGFCYILFSGGLPTP